MLYGYDHLNEGTDVGKRTDLIVDGDEWNNFVEVRVLPEGGAEVCEPKEVRWGHQGPVCSHKKVAVRGMVGADGFWWERAYCLGCGEAVEPFQRMSGDPETPACAHGYPKERVPCPTCRELLDILHPNGPGRPPFPAPPPSLEDEVVRVGTLLGGAVYCLRALRMIPNADQGVVDQAVKLCEEYEAQLRRLVRSIVPSSSD